MPDTRTPDEIERDIERERAELGQTVEELQARFSPDRIMREIGRGLSEHGADIGTAVTRSVKRNPVALALTGIGLAWLMSGKSWGSAANDEPGYAEAPRRLPAPDRRRATGGVPGYAGSYDRAADYTAPGGLNRSTFDDRVGYGAYPEDPLAMREPEDDWLWADDDAFWDDEDDYFDDDHDGGTGLGERLSGAASDAGDRVGAAGDRVVAGAQSAASRIGS
ncbi:DUF3618 domain-containing protein, partial [Rhodobacterales bacterium HKCCE2091]|nr:DUF3618 domain-containing protein [Rhodobacterales bacterium HKCCE2091]